MIEQLHIRFELAPPDRIQERFEAFDREHPEVFSLFRRAAESLRAQGRTRFGTAAIFERMRWFSDVGAAESGYRLNNDFRSRLARKLIAECPDFEGFLEIRRLRSEPKVEK